MYKNLQTDWDTSSGLLFGRVASSSTYNSNMVGKKSNVFKEG